MPGGCEDEAEGDAPGDKLEEGEGVGVEDALQATAQRPSQHRGVVPCTLRVAVQSELVEHVQGRRPQIPPQPYSKQLPEVEQQPTGEGQQKLGAPGQAYG